MKSPRHEIGRRSFLRGAGACIALPSMVSLDRSLEANDAKEADDPSKARGVTASGAPLRTAYLYYPNGVIMDAWRPKGTGTDFEFNESMKPIEGFRDDLRIIKGYAQKTGNPGKDGAGDHARANATYLTGVRPHRTSGADIRLGVSADQLAARFLARETRLPSIELSCERIRNTGSCDAGYSCAYNYNLSWRSEYQPMTPESNPRAVFERMFGSGPAKERAARRAERRSILDFVQDSAAEMERRLGRKDRGKLDEYLTGVREIEQRLERIERLGPPADPGRPAPSGAVPESFREHIRILLDMTALAFQSDSTRVVSFMIGTDGSNRSIREAGVSEGHHDLSHHGNDKGKMAKVRQVDRFYLEELAYFLDRMKKTKDADGQTLLHNSMVVWGSGLSDGNAHTHVDLPIILAGNAGGNFQTGRHIDVGDVPLNNLFVRLLQEVGLEGAQFGDSTGVETRI